MNNYNNDMDLEKRIRPILTMKTVWLFTIIMAVLGLVGIVAVVVDFLNLEKL